jgi:citrate synthase
LPPDLFTPTFAVGRVLGWSAHCLEQLRDGRLIRPQSSYIGPRDLRYRHGPSALGPENASASKTGS